MSASGVYLLAVFHRTSLGVAGPQAAERLDLSAGQLSTFVMLQLGVYAAMQVPTGILVDRFGPRRMLLVATIIMGSAQLLFSQVESYPLALVARGLLGCGDAMTYVSVLRLVAGWFPGRRYPVMVTLTSVVGMAGNVVATVPLTIMLATLGWSPTFAIAGGLSLAYALLLLRPAGAAPYRKAESSEGPLGGRKVLQEVKTAWRLPAGRLGFWIHLSTMAGPTVFAVLWGYPYLTQGLGLPARPGVIAAVAAGGRRALRQPGPRARCSAADPGIRGALALIVATSVSDRLADADPVAGRPTAGLGGRGDRLRVLRRRSGVRDRLHAGPRLQPAAPDLHRDRAGQRRRLLRLGGDGVRRRSDPGLAGTGCGGALPGRLPVGAGRHRGDDGLRHLPDDDLAAAHPGRRAPGGRPRRGGAGGDPSRTAGTCWTPASSPSSASRCTIARTRSPSCRKPPRDRRTPPRDGSRRSGRPVDTRPAPALPVGGGLLLVDKPSGCTSHDVVGRLRHVLRTRRIGHAGTLDPMATGLLVLAVDRSTKLLGHLALTDKTYLATIRLGQQTDTDDADGLIVAVVARRRRRRRRHRGRGGRADRAAAAGAQLGVGDQGRRPPRLRPGARRGDRRAGRAARHGVPVRDPRRPPRRTRQASSTWMSPWSAPPAPTSGRWPGTWARRSASAGTSPGCGAPWSDRSTSPTRLTCSAAGLAREPACRNQPVTDGLRRVDRGGR